MDFAHKKVVEFSSRRDAVTQLPIDSIRMNPYQPRKEFARSSLVELANSILEYGVLQPISVRVLKSGTYELIAGERRLRASRLAGLREIPAIIFQINDNDSAILALVENLQRENLNYMEEAEGYYCLLTEHGFTQEELSAKVGKSQSTIANKIRLLRLPPMVKRIISENNLSERHARSLLRLPDKQLQIRALKNICDKGMSVQETEEMVKEMLEKYVRPDPNRAFCRSEIAEARQKRGRVKFIVKDIRIFVNTIREAVNMMKEAGIKARAAQFDRDEYIEFVIRIPKKENGITMRSKELTAEAAPVLLPAGEN